MRGPRIYRCGGSVRSEFLPCISTLLPPRTKFFGNLERADPDDPHVEHLKRALLLRIAELEMREDKSDDPEEGERFAPRH